jgi:hypothetical protein
MGDSIGSSGLFLFSCVVALSVSSPLLMDEKVTLSWFERNGRQGLVGSTGRNSRSRSRSSRTTFEFLRPYCGNCGANVCGGGTFVVDTTVAVATTVMILVAVDLVLAPMTLGFKEETIGLCGEHSHTSWVAARNGNFPRLESFVAGSGHCE